MRMHLGCLVRDDQQLRLAPVVVAHEAAQLPLDALLGHLARHHHQRERALVGRLVEPLGALDAGGSQTQRPGLIPPALTRQGLGRPRLASSRGIKPSARLVVPCPVCLTEYKINLKASRVSWRELLRLTATDQPLLLRHCHFVLLMGPVLLSTLPLS